MRTLPLSLLVTWSGGPGSERRQRQTTKAAKGAACRVQTEKTEKSKMGGSVSDSSWVLVSCEHGRLCFYFFPFFWALSLPQPLSLWNHG